METDTAHHKLLFLFRFSL